MSKSLLKILNNWVRCRISNFTANMPLNVDIYNYDDYWKGREKEGKLPLILPRYKIANSYIVKNSSVLDIGCGDGSFLEFLSQQNKNLKLFGLDISEHAVSLSKKKAICAKVCNVTSDDFHLKNEYDYICLLDLIEHLQNCEFLIQRIKNKFRKYLFISIPNLGYIENRLRLCIAGKMPLTNIIHNINEHVRFWTVKDFLCWADYLGLSVVAYHGQYGIRIPVIKLWQRFPKLFASGIIYILKRK